MNPWGGTGQTAQGDLLFYLFIYLFFFRCLENMYCEGHLLGCLLEYQPWPGGVHTPNLRDALESVGWGEAPMAIAMA